MIVYQKTKNDKKVIISKSVYADGNNYYIHKFRINTQGYEFSTGILKTGDSIKSIKKAKFAANQFLNNIIK